MASLQEGWRLGLVTKNAFVSCHFKRISFGYKNVFSVLTDFGLHLWTYNGQYGLDSL